MTASSVLQDWMAEGPAAGAEPFDNKFQYESHHIIAQLQYCKAILQLCQLILYEISSVTGRKRSKKRILII